MEEDGGRERSFSANLQVCSHEPELLSVINIQSVRESELETVYIQTSTGSSAASAAASGFGLV